MNIKKILIYTYLILILMFITSCSGPIIDDKDDPVACTMEANICPDGSYVSRVGPDCKFEECPVKPPVSSNQSKGKCGDGICDEEEKVDLRLCPEDCADNNLTPSLPDQSNDECDLNEDGQVDEFEEEKCSQSNNLDECDLNKDGQVDEFEEERCSQSNNLDECDLNEDGQVDEFEEERCANLQESTFASKEINFHKLATETEFGSSLKLFYPAIDEENNLLYVTGSRTKYLTVIDTEKKVVIDSYNIGVYGGFLIFENEKLYLYQFEKESCYEVDIEKKEVGHELGISYCEDMMPKQGENVIWNDYSFKGTGYGPQEEGDSGFSPDWRQDLNGAYGVIDIYKGNNKNKVGEIVHGPDALYFTIEYDTGLLWTADTGDGMVKIFDLNQLENTNYCEENKCFVKMIDVGTSVDEILKDSFGNIWARSRLGGSQIFKYNLDTENFTIIEDENIISNQSAIFSNNNWNGDGIGIWPTGMALSEKEDKLFVLSHYGARIDVIDTNSNKVVDKIKLRDYIDLFPRTDAISTLIIDKESNVLYAGIPEAGIIAMIDGEKHEVIGSIDLTQFSFFEKDKNTNTGQGLINLVADEDKLYVSLYKSKKLLLFKIKDENLELINEKSIDRVDKTEHLLSINGNNLYLGNFIYDKDNLENIGNFSKGSKVVGFNDNNVYLNDVKADREILYEYTDDKLTQTWNLDEVGIIPSTYYFDFDKNLFYAATFITGTVKEYNLKK